MLHFAIVIINMSYALYCGLVGCITYQIKMCYKIIILYHRIILSMICFVL